MRPTAEDVVLLLVPEPGWLDAEDHRDPHQDAMMPLGEDPLRDQDEADDVDAALGGECAGLSSSPPSLRYDWVCVLAPPGEEWTLRALRGLADHFPWLITEKRLLQCTPPFTRGRSRLVATRP